MTRRAGIRAVSALFVTLLTQPAPAATLTTVEPRAFGYSLGDTFERRLIVDLPAPLPDSALPKPGRRGGLELRRVSVERQRLGTLLRHEIRLQYQVFTAPTEPRALTLPGFELATGGGDVATVAEFRVYVSPLVPAEFAGDSALGTLRPDTPARPIATAAGRTRLLASAAAALLLALLLAWRQFGDRLFASRRGPFGVAWHELRRLDAAAPDAGRQALRHLHRAFDASAGTTLFAEGVDGYIAARPEFAPQRQGILDFFAASRRAFFAADAANGSDALPAVLALCAACRAIERSAR